jgi:metal-responsive CopG/Arc/MetJ family transcriptional regulator
VPSSHYNVNIKMREKLLAPPKKDTEALTLRISRELIAHIDEARRAEEDLPTRPEMIRRVLQEWCDRQRDHGTNCQ